MYAKFALSFLLATSVCANPFEAARTNNKDAAKAKYMSSLMRGAKPTARSQIKGRKLDEDEYMPDITGFSLKFEQCQFVKAYDDEMADDEEGSTILATQRFVIFRLCPTGSDSCDYNYGEYIIDMEEYLEAFTAYAEEQQEEFCQTCDEYCEQEEEEEDDGGRKKRKLQDYDCSCVDICYKVENMGENGYIDATEYLECQAIYEADDDGSALYAGPYCSGGEKIKIGVFEDENCMFLDSSKDVEDYLIDDDGVSSKLSYDLLKMTYDQDTAVSCLVPAEEEDEERRRLDEEEEAEVTELCQQLYEEAAKCEKTNGFDDGYADYAAYENQYSQEGVVCDFISALKSGTYSETGDIQVSGGSVMTGGGSSATGGQKFALVIFVLGTVGLAVYAATLHTQLTKSDKADLSKQGGAMA